MASTDDEISEISEVSAISEMGELSGFFSWVLQRDPNFGAAMQNLDRRFFLVVLSLASSPFPS